MLLSFSTTCSEVFRLGTVDAAAEVTITITAATTTTAAAAAAAAAAATTTTAAAAATCSVRTMHVSDTLPGLKGQ